MSGPRHRSPDWQEDHRVRYQRAKAPIPRVSDTQVLAFPFMIGFHSRSASFGVGRVSFWRGARLLFVKLCGAPLFLGGARTTSDVEDAPIEETEAENKTDVIEEKDDEEQAEPPKKLIKRKKKRVLKLKK